MTNIEPFLADGITLGIPNTSATSIEQIDNAIFVDANGNLTFRDNFTANNTDVNGNPLVALTLQDLYTNVKGIYVVDGALYFKDSTVSRPYSLQELVGAYIDWQNRLTTGGIFWVGSTRITNAECNNLMVNVNGDPNLPVNTPAVSGVGRVFEMVGGAYPSYATGTEVFSIDEFLSTQTGNFQFNADGSWKWYDIPNLNILIPPMDSYKTSYIISKLNVRLIQADSPIVFRLYDTTTGTELDRKAVSNNVGNPVEQQPVLSFVGVLPSYQTQLQQLACQCPTTDQTAALAVEPPHTLSVQFHVDTQLFDPNDDIYQTMVANISGSLFEDVPNYSEIRYNALERRLIGLPNGITTDPIVNSNIDVLIFDTSPDDSNGRKVGSIPFSNINTYNVVFDVPFTSAEYSITLSCNMNINTWYTNKTAAGFTIRSGKSFTGSIDWIATKILQGD